MDYGASYGKERISGRGFFFPTVASPAGSGIDLGNVQMFKIEFGVKRKDHYSARRGIVTLDRMDAYGTMGVWTITVDEFVTPLLPLMWLGTANTDVTQAQDLSGAFVFTTKKGAVYDVGKYGLYDTSVTFGHIEGTDYDLDRGGGKIYWRLGASVDGVQRTLNYKCPALTYDSVTPLNSLNRTGTLEVHGEDDSGQGKNTAFADAVAPIRYVFTIPCILGVDDGGDFRVDDYRKVTIKATATAPMTIKRLK